jgi:hypothetical protein
VAIVGSTSSSAPQGCHERDKKIMVDVVMERLRAAASFMSFPNGADAGEQSKHL